MQYKGTIYSKLIILLVCGLMMPSCQNGDQRQQTVNVYNAQLQQAQWLEASQYAEKESSLFETAQEQDFATGSLWLLSDSLVRAMPYLDKASLFASESSGHTLAMYNRSLSYVGLDSLDAAISILKAALQENGFHRPSAYNLAVLQRIKDLRVQQQQQSQQQSDEKQKQENEQQQSENAQNDPSDQNSDNASDGQSQSEQDKKKEDGKSSTENKAISMQEAQRLLEIMKNEEQETLKKLRNRQAKPNKKSKQDW